MYRNTVFRSSEVPKSAHPAFQTMIETFKTIRKIYDEEALPNLTLSTIERTRFHQYKLFNKSVRCDMRKYYFTDRIVNMCNSLPDAVVSSSTVNQFKKNLDRYCVNKK